MHNKDMKDRTFNSDNIMDPINEPEEGEIVDDFELISSDEENCMRERIRELEEKNAEIEQIAVISRSYDLDRAARIPTDVSSISSTEFKTPKKRKRHKNKDRKKKSCHHHHGHRHHGTSSQNDKKTTRSRKTRCKRREKLLKKKHDKYAYKDFSDKLPLESPDSLHSTLSSSSLTDSDGSIRLVSAEEIRDEDDYYHKPGIRDTLRLAVARHRKNSTRQPSHKNGLKEKLMRKDDAFTGNLFASEVEDDVDDEDDDAVEICEPEADIHIVPDDSSDSLEEKELRLIALKSAVLKKHMERKRRNAEAAYSPTDFDEMMMHEDKLADIEVVDLEEEEDSQNGCVTASPIASPQLMLLDGQDDSTQMVDCKPVDMDIANSDSEGASANNWNLEMPRPMPFPPFHQNDLNNPFSYGAMYMREFPESSSNPPPPPGVDDYEETKQPLMKLVKYQDFDAQDMELENDFEPIVSYPCNSQSAAITLHELKLNSNTASLHSSPNEEDIQEEEELALRALLLSKLQSPKNQKKSVLVETKENTNEFKPNSEISNRAVKPTEAILKEAVKRLQIHSQVETQHESFNVTSSWVHQQQSESRKDECFHDIPLPWNHPMQIKIERDCFSAKPPAQLYDHQKQEHLPCPQDLKDDSKELATVALVSLQRKAKELKNFGETKEVVRAQYANGTVCDDTSVAETVNEIEANEITIDPVQTMDEDNKRRLQKLKDDILSATRMKDLQPEIENSVPQAECVHPEIANKAEEVVVNKIVKDIIIATVNPAIERCELINENVTNDLTSEDRLDKPKSVKVHLDVTKTLTTSKANIQNTISSVNKAEIAIDKTALKENNVNSVNKKMQKVNADIPANNKTTQEPRKITRTLTKTISLAKIKDTILSQTKPLTTNAAATSLPLITVSSNSKPTLSVPTYSVMRTTKIVKPNKVINRNIDTKRRVILIKSEPPAPPAKLMKLDPSATRRVDTSRLITSMEQVKHMCNVAQLVISVQNSSNESSDEEWANCDTMYRPLAEYNDIASPLSLHLESPCLTPIRSNSPNDLALSKEKITFEEKVNNMLKAKRSPVTVKALAEKIVSPKTPVPVQNVKTPQNHNLKTPVAVRHLPAAAQDEYRKLIHRMKMLENQRHKKDCLSSNEEKAVGTDTEAKIENESTLTGIKPSLVKQVLLRNANNKPSTDLDNSKTLTEHSPPPKAHKANVLRSYESLYVKIGAGIVNNLDKSLRLVEEAKKAKVNKLKLESRLKELKAEMDMLQTKHKDEEQKISRIYPTICTTNEVITSLKQKRSKVFKAAISLGKTLKGEDYRLNNDLKQNIISKTKQLADEIKLVNSLKAANMNMLLEVVVPTETEQMEIEKNCPGETINPNVKESPENAQKESNEQNDSESSTQNGGNTEFQDTAPCDKNGSECETNGKPLTEADAKEEEDVEEDDKPLTSYISPLEHLRNIDGTMDPNGVICPYDLMGNCEDVSCKYVHISPQDKNETKPS